MVKIRSIFRLILAVYFMVFYFTKRICYFTVDKEASASGALCPLDLLPRSSFRPPDLLLCSTQPWRQIDACASAGNVGQVIMETIAYDTVP